MTLDAPPARQATPPSTSLGARTSAVLCGLGLLVLLGVVARLWPRRALWLDEAQSVAIASDALTSIPEILRTDGAPPAYYLVLHGWMTLFGDGDYAVRSLSILLSLATLVVVAVVVQRIANTRAAIAVTVLVATNPFIIRYATEGRMYALVMLEVVLGVLVLDAYLRRPSAGRAVALVALTALLLYTHYWSVYLVVGVAIVLAVAARRPGPARTALFAIGAGVVLWLPWVPTFMFQSEHTSTPWAEPARASSLAAVFDIGLNKLGPLPAFLGVTLFFLMVFAVWRGPSLVRHPLSVRAIFAVLALTLVGALLGAMSSDSAYASRYTAVAVPLMIILAAVGAALLRPRWAIAVLTFAGVIGLALAAAEVVTARTRSAAFVGPLEALVTPDDVLVYCPDQLGPAASRLLDQAGLDLRQIVFPPRRAPNRVDWIDYAQRHRAANPDSFVDGLLQGTPNSSIWLVISSTYPPTQRACRGLFHELQAARHGGQLVVQDDPSLSDHGALWRFDP